MIQNVTLRIFLRCTFALSLFSTCTDLRPRTTSERFDHAFEQTRVMLDSLNQKDGGKLPKTLSRNGSLIVSSIYDWTSGFFPGTLWFLYAQSGDSFWQAQAHRFTKLLNPVKDFYGHHDVGFIIMSSFGNGYRITGDSSYASVIVTAAHSLAKRFNPTVGAIQSWDVDKGWQRERGWKFPVIIDNVMNLELFFEATAISGDSTFYQMAVSHADVTLRNHFRTDYSCYHVVDYEPADGSVRTRQTAQGHSDSSSWARGQAWALYGYTMCYARTGLTRYLEQAKHIASFIINHPRLPEDKVPYWDFDSPDIPDTYRDASSAAIISSALLQLAGFVDAADAERYQTAARVILDNLSAEPYLAEPKKNSGFLLKHSVGSIPHGNEIDVPLSYADYYYLEALLRDVETTK